VAPALALKQKVFFRTLLAQGSIGSNLPFYSSTQRAFAISGGLGAVAFIASKDPVSLGLLSFSCSQSLSPSSYLVLPLWGFNYPMGETVFRLGNLYMAFPFHGIKSA